MRITNFLQISRDLRSYDADIQEIATNPRFLKNAKQFEARAISLLSDLLDHTFFDECIKKDLRVFINFKYLYECPYGQSASKITQCDVHVRLAKKQSISILEEINSAYQSQDHSETLMDSSLSDEDAMFFTSILDKNRLKSCRFDSAYNFLKNQIHDNQLDWIVCLLAKNYACDLITIKRIAITSFLEKLHKKATDDFVDFQKEMISGFKLPITDLKKDVLLNIEFLKLLAVFVGKESEAFHDKNGQPILAYLWSMKIPCCTSAFAFFSDVLAVDVLDHARQTTFYKTTNKKKNVDVACSIAEADFFKLGSFVEECLTFSSIADSLSIGITNNDFLLSQIIHNILSVDGILGDCGDVDYLMFGGCPNVYKEDLRWDGEIYPLWQIDASDVEHIFFDYDDE